MFFLIQLVRNFEIFGGKEIAKQNQLSRQRQEAPTVHFTATFIAAAHASKHTMRTRIAIQFSSPPAGPPTPIQKSPAPQTGRSIGRTNTELRR